MLRFNTLILFMLLIIPPLLFSQQTTDIAVNHTKFASINVLVNIDTNTSKGKISQEDIVLIKNGIRLGRDFFWRNSSCQLNLNITYLETDEFKDRKSIPVTELYSPLRINNDLKKNNISDHYGIIITISNLFSEFKNKNRVKIYENCGYSFIKLHTETTLKYPNEDINTNLNMTWKFIQNIQRHLNILCYEKTDMMNSEKPLDDSIKSGEYYSYYAEILRNFSKYLKVDPETGTIEQAIDNDNDKFPDNDSRVPVDEIHFGSDTTSADSDNDGLGDLEEFKTGIFKSSLPNKADSDRDRQKDGDDLYPLHNIHHKIPKVTPAFADKWKSWFVLSSDLDFSSSNFIAGTQFKAKTYLNWDENYLYFGCEINAPTDLHLDLDLQNNGWFHGQDNYRLVVDPLSNRFKEIKAMDTSKKTREHHKSLNKIDSHMWDNELEYISKFGKIIDETTIILKTVAFEDKYIIKIKIPNNPNIPFKLTKNAKIGLRIYFTLENLMQTDSWASIYEPYEFFEVILK